MNTSTLLPKSRAQLPVIACLVAISLPSVFAQTSVRDQRVVPVTRDARVVDATRPLKKGDRDFVEKAARTSMSEIAISRVAAARTSNPDVRRFAQSMIEDHESAMEQLTGLASVRAVALPAKDPHPDKWEKRDAKSFDKDYLEKMIDDHESAVKLFEKHAKNGEDADTVEFARKNLPKLQQHLQHALDLKRALTDKRDHR